MHRIQLSAGIKLPGFIYVDNKAGADIRIGKNGHLPIRKNTVHAFYVNGFLEFLSQSAGVAFLRECRRVLIEGGILRVVSPDLDHIIKEYKNLKINNTINPSQVNSKQVDSACRRLNQSVIGSGHRWVYNAQELVRLALVAGLSPMNRESSGVSYSDGFPKEILNGESGLIHEFKKDRVLATNELPLVSILITAYKAEYFQEALESALNQSYPNLEIIVCDDSPADQIQKIIEDYNKRDSRIRYYKNKQHIGGRKNYMKSFELARGEFIKYLNDDDKLHPQCVERMAFCLQNYPEVTLVTSHRQLIDSNGNDLEEQFFNRRPVNSDSLIDGATLANILLKNAVNFIGEPTTVMFRKSDLEGTLPNIFSFGGRPALANGDVTIWTNLLSKGDAIYLVDSLSYFRQHEHQRQRESGFADLGERAWRQVQFDAKRMGLLAGEIPGSIPVCPIDVMHPNLEPVAENLKYAAELVAADDFQSALAELAQAQKRVGDSPDLHYTIGNILLQMGEIESAAKNFIKAISLAPAYVPPYFGYAITLIKAGQLNEAELAMQKVLYLEPFNGDALRLLGEMRFEKQNLGDAAQCFAKLHRLSPQDPQITTWLARCYVESGDYTKADNLCEKALKSDAGNKMAKYIRAEIRTILSKDNQQIRAGQNASTKKNYKPKAQKKPAVSIIIPVYNQLHFTQTCLEKLFKNTGSQIAYEIILIDNASEDGTAEYLKSIAQLHPNIKLISNAENLGFSKGCNIGANHARGEYLLFLNNDTEPQPGWLENLLNPLLQDEQVGIVGAKLLYPDGTIQHAGIGFLPLESPVSLGQYGVVLAAPDHVHRFAAGDSPEVNEFREMDMVTGACLCISAENFRKVGGFDEGYVNGSEDADLCLKIRELGLKVIYNPEAVLIHHERKSWKRFDKLLSNLERFFVRWGHHFDGSWQFNRNFSSIDLVTDKSSKALQISKTSKVSEEANAVFKQISEELLKGDASPDFKVAVTKYLDFLHKFPNYALAHNELGVLYFQNGKIAEAIHHLQIAYRLDGSNLNTRKNLADIYLHLDFVDMAVRHYKEVLISNPNDLETIDILGELSLQFGQQESAMQLYSRAVSIDPKNPAWQQKLKNASLPQSIIERAESPTQAEDGTQPYKQVNRFETIGCPFCGSIQAKQIRQQADIVKCEDCSTVYLRTRLVKSEMEKLYQSYADDGSHMQLPSNPQQVKESGLRRDYFLNEILEFTKLQGKILDVGCGWGAFLDNARDKGFSPRGIEVTKKAANFANTTLDIEVTSGQLEDTEFESGSFGVVSMLHVLEHLPQPEKALKHVYEILQPGGMFCGIVPNIDSFASQHLREDWEWLDPNYHYVHYSWSVLKRQLEIAGFVLERIYTATGDFSRLKLKDLVKEVFQLEADDHIEEIIRSMEENGYGEEIRFFARKVDLKNQDENLKQIYSKQEEPEPVSNAINTNARKKREPNKKQYDVSIVIPLFNQVDYTKKCLETLYKNSGSDVSFEVILVDNASTDGTKLFVEEAGKNYPNLKFIRKENNLKFAKACNQGAKLAQGKYLVFLNNDTEPEAGWLTNALSRFEQDGNIGVVGSKLLYPDRTVQHCGIEFMENVNPDYKFWPLHRFLNAAEDDPNVNWPEEVQAVTGACLFIPRRLFKKVRGFTEDYGMYFEDTDLCFKVKKAGKKVFYEPTSLVIHHEGKSSPDQKVIDELNRKAAIIFYRRWASEILRIELESWIERTEGKFVFLKEGLFPENYEEGDVTKTAIELGRLFQAFEPFYAHFGGVGDALLLLSTFYDQNPVQTIVSISSSTSALKSFFEVFPSIKKVYFIPRPQNDISHALLRKVFPNLNNCRGMGVAPENEFYEDEWVENIDIFSKYKLAKRPYWIKQFKKDKLERLQVTIHPRGSMKGMVGSKKNIIDQKYWIELFNFFKRLQIRPVILGTPDERVMYPAILGAHDKRSYNFREQMELIASSDLFIGADSWGKTMSALASVPSIVFHSIRGSDLEDWQDASDYVFIYPWEEICLVKDFEEFREVCETVLPEIRSGKRITGMNRLNRMVRSENDSTKDEKHFYLWREMGIGDVLMALPTCRALKEKYPQSKVSFISAAGNEEILLASPWVDEFYPAKDLFQLKGRAGKIYDLNPSKFGTEPLHQVDAFLQEFRLNPAPEKKEITLQLPPAVGRKIDKIIKEQVDPLRKVTTETESKVVLIHAAKGDRNRTWPKKNWESLIRTALSKNHIPVLVGNDSTNTARGVFRFGMDGVVDLVNAFSPLEFVALCRHADLLITTDSGPVQLAAASDIAIAGIYSVVSGHYRLPYRHGFFGWNAVSIEPECELKSCYRLIEDEKNKQIIRDQIKEKKLTLGEIFGNWCPASEKYACMEKLISAQMVWEKSKSLLSGGEFEKPGEDKSDTQTPGKTGDEKSAIQHPDSMNSTLENLYNVALAFHTAGEYNQAILKLNQIIEGHPDFARAYYLLGLISVDLDKPEDALSFLAIAIEKESGFLDAQHAYGQCLISLNRLDEAKQAFRMILQNHPDDSESSELLEKLNNKGNSHETPPIPENPNGDKARANSELLKSRFQRFRKAGNQSEYQTALAEYLSTQPTDAEALNEMGIFHFQNQDIDQAVKYFEQAVHHNGDHPHHLLNLADAYIAREEFEKGIKILLLLINRFPEDFEAYHKLADLYFEDGDHRTGREIISRYLDKYPDSTFAQTVYDLMEDPVVYVAYRFINDGNLKEAEELLGKVLAANPGSQYAKLGLGSILVNDEKYEEAEEIYREILDEFPKTEEAVFYLSKLYLNQNKFDELEDHRQVYAELFAESQLLQKQWVESLMAQGKLEEAASAMEEYLRKQKKDPEALLLSGNLFYEQGKPEKAQEQYAAVLRIDPDNEIARENLQILLQEQTIKS